MLAWLLAMILGIEFDMMEHPRGEMMCDGPMITMDPTFTEAYVLEGDSEVIYVEITNNCNQDLALDLEFAPAQEGTSLGEIRLIYYPDDLARGGEVDDVGPISLSGLVLPAYETDIRGLVFYADEIDVDGSYSVDTRWFDVFVIDDNMQPIFHAETGIEIVVFEMPEEAAGGEGF